MNTTDPANARELYLTKRLENIEQCLSVSKLERDILDLETALKKEEDDVNVLEQFLEDVNSKQLITDVQMENHKIETQKAINDIMSKLVSLCGLWFNFSSQKQSLQPKNVSEANEAKFLNVISKIELMNKGKK